jgi:hemerythrin-like domain-containing protein
MPDHSGAAGTAPAARTFHQLHAAFRADAERLRATVAAWSSDDRAALAGLARWWRRYREQVRAHHRVEDELWFPAVAARSPDFVVQARAAMADDHRYLDALLDRVDIALTRLADPTAPFEPARRDAVTAVAALASLLADHFAEEERSVVPLIEQSCTAEEIADLGRRSDRAHSRAELRFLVPWFFDHLEPGERAEVLREAGWTIRALHCLSRPAYRRTVRAAGLTSALRP